MSRSIQPFWKPFPAGIALGLALLLTFLLTGHGLNVTGFTARLSAWLGGVFAPSAIQWNAYLGPLFEGWSPFAEWATWEIIGIALGGLIGSLIAGRFRIQVESAAASGIGKRLAWAFAGGALAGFGARIARGCTSSIGLSGSATLAVAGFVFLAAFFVFGLITSRLMRRVRQ